MVNDEHLDLEYEDFNKALREGNMAGFNFDNMLASQHAAINALLAVGQTALASAERMAALKTIENLVISTYNEFSDDPAVNRIIDIAVLDKMEELINAYK